MHLILSNGHVQTAWIRMRRRETRRHRETRRLIRLHSSVSLPNNE